MKGQGRPDRLVLGTVSLSKSTMDYHGDTRTRLQGLCSVFPARDRSPETRDGSSKERTQTESRRVSDTNPFVPSETQRPNI